MRGTVAGLSHGAASYVAGTSHAASWHARCCAHPAETTTWGYSAMIEMLVGGFLLTGSVCILEDGDLHRDCRDIPAIRFGNKYSCDQRVESILGSFPYLRPERLGFPEGERLRVQVKCKPSAASA